MTHWMKPEYCTHKKLDCLKCEFYKEGLCYLNEDYRKILDEILDEEGTL